MFRKYFVPVLLVAQVLVFLLLVSVLARQPSASAANDAVPQMLPMRRKRRPPRTASMYGVTLRNLCAAGSDRRCRRNPQGEFIVKPGNYATEINIHNPNYKQVPLRKKFLVLVNR